MRIGRPQLWMLLTGALSSGLLHAWISRATAWELINSKFQFLVWPGLAGGAPIHRLVPESLSVPYDPLPHPFVLWAALLVNFAVWAAIFFGLAAAIRLWVVRSRT